MLAEELVKPEYGFRLSVREDTERVDEEILGRMRHALARELQETQGYSPGEQLKKAVGGSYGKTFPQPVAHHAPSRYIVGSRCRIFHGFEWNDGRIRPNDRKNRIRSK